MRSQMAKDRRAARRSDAHLTAAAQFQPGSLRGKQQPLTPQPAPEAIAAEGTGVVKVEEGAAAVVSTHPCLDVYSSAWSLL